MDYVKWVLCNHSVARPQVAVVEYGLQLRTVALKKKETKSPWPEYASELYRPRDRHLSAKLVPTFADRGCHVVSVTDPYSLNLGFLDRSRYFSIK
jgi:hypothetical protein